MPLSRHTDYTYRVLLYLAANRKRCTLGEVADFYDISMEHLRKVIHKLGKLNYINTYQGKNGGFELNKSPADIRLGAIYREFEKGPIIDCNKRECNLTGNCKLTKILLDAEKSLLQELDKFTLSDLVDKRSIAVLKVVGL